MKRFIYALLLPIMLVGCKKHDFETPPAIKELVGKWRLKAVEKTVNGQTVWEDASGMPEPYLVFRFDGVILNENGTPPCCAPSSLVLNGVPFEIKPLVTVPKLDGCANVSCVLMPYWNLQQNADTLIVTPGVKLAYHRFRYIRD